MKQLPFDSVQMTNLCVCLLLEAKQLYFMSLSPKIKKLRARYFFFFFFFKNICFKELLFFVRRYCSKTGVRRVRRLAKISQSVCSLFYCSKKPIHKGIQRFLNGLIFLQSGTSVEMSVAESNCTSQFLRVSCTFLSRPAKLQVRTFQFGQSSARRSCDVAPPITLRWFDIFLTNSFFYMRHVWVERSGIRSRLSPFLRSVISVSHWNNNLFSRQEVFFQSLIRHSPPNEWEGCCRVRTLQGRNALNISSPGHTLKRDAPLGVSTGEENHISDSGVCFIPGKAVGQFFKRINPKVH